MWDATTRLSFLSSGDGLVSASMDLIQLTFLSLPLTLSPSPSPSWSFSMFRWPALDGITQERTKRGKLSGRKAVLLFWSLLIPNREIIRASSFFDASNSSSIRLKSLIWWMAGRDSGTSFNSTYQTDYDRQSHCSIIIYLFYIMERPNRLRLFRHFDPFRILICSGDGSIGWVLSEIDKLHMDVSYLSFFISSLSFSIVCWRAHIVVEIEDKRL